MNKIVQPNISLDVLKKAIDIYIKIAYKNSDIPVNVKEKIEKIRKSATIDEALSIFNFEMINQIESYKLQLGSSQYPFLKLVLEKASFDSSSENNFGFYIDRHSEYIAVDSSSPTFQKELELKENTYQLKKEIENDFEKNGILTYRKMVRNYVDSFKTNLTESSISKKGKFILLVEDDIDINEMHKLELMFLGYDVETVFNGYDALKMVENKYFDLMFLDLMMSGISGQEVIKRAGKEIDIVVLSALSDKFTKDTCLSLGAKAFLSKPVFKEDLRKFLDDFFKNKNTKG
ncbi:MAG TPA: response regulator [Exilispira sp.]|nr:response regulator [Exilispira sp.]